MPHASTTVPGPGERLRFTYDGWEYFVGTEHPFETWAVAITSPRVTTARRKRMLERIYTHGWLRPLTRWTGRYITVVTDAAHVADLKYIQAMFQFSLVAWHRRPVDRVEVMWLAAQSWDAARDIAADVRLVDFASEDLELAWAGKPPNPIEQVVPEGPGRAPEVRETARSLMRHADRVRKEKAQR